MARYPRKLMPLEGAIIPMYDKYLEVIISPSESDIERHYVSHFEGERDKHLEELPIERDGPIKSEEIEVAPKTVTPAVETPKKRKSIVSLASKKQARGGKALSAPRLLPPPRPAVFPKGSDERSSAKSLDRARVAKRKVKPDVVVDKELDAVNKLRSSVAIVKSTERRSSVLSHRSSASSASTRFKSISTEADLAENILEAMFKREIVKDERDNVLESFDSDSSLEQSVEMNRQVEKNLDRGVSDLLTTPTQQETLADQIVTQMDDAKDKLPKKQVALPKLTKQRSFKRKTPKLPTETEPEVVITDSSMTERKREVTFKAEKKSWKKSSQYVTDISGYGIEKKPQGVTTKPGRKEFDKARASMELKADTKAETWLKHLLSQKVLLHGQRKLSVPQPASKTEGLEIPFPEPPISPSERMSDGISSTSLVMSESIFMDFDRESRRKSSMKPPAGTVRPADEESQGMQEHFHTDRKMSLDAHRTALERSFRHASRQAKKELLPERLGKPSKHTHKHAPPKCADVDPRTLVENYMNNKHVYKLFQYLTGKLLVDAPENPLDYLIDLVRTIDTTEGLSGIKFCS